MTTASSLNVYHVAAGIAFRRFTWDLRMESWRSRKKLASLHNTQKGKKAVILCNGPSLNDVDFDLLNKAYTFGLNKINLMFDKHTFRPSCIVAVNPYVIEHNKEFYAETTIPLILDRRALNIGVPSTENRIYLHPVGWPSFTRRCTGSIYQGYTVTYVAMQIAFHMGFQKVALVGCDHYFGEDQAPNELRVAGERDPWHFDEQYFSDGMEWQLPDLPQSESSYSRALVAYRKANRTLCNCTAGGKLKLIPRLTLQEFLDDG